MKFFGNASLTPTSTTTIGDTIKSAYVSATQGYTVPQRSIAIKIHANITGAATQSTLAKCAIYNFNGKALVPYAITEEKTISAALGFIYSFYFPKPPILRSDGQYFLSIWGNVVAGENASVRINANDIKTATALAYAASWPGTLLVEIGIFNAPCIQCEYLEGDLVNNLKIQDSYLGGYQLMH